MYGHAGRLMEIWGNGSHWKGETVTKIVYICKPCPQCGTRLELNLDPIKVEEWQKATKIQDAFPELQPFEREAMISGVCSDECWKKLWKLEE